MRNRFFSLLIMVAAMLTIFACQPSTKTSDDASGTDVINKEEIEKSLLTVAYPLPEPFEVYGMLEDIGASYLGDVLNPVANSEKYLTQKSQALGIGVYAADLGYAVTYNKQEDVKAYSLTLKSLIDGLGVKIDYAKLQDEASRQKLADKDSLVGFVTNTFYDTYSFLSKESVPALSGLMAAAAWVEGLYIATHISDDTFNNTEIVKIIYGQGESLAKLIDLLKNFESDERVGSLLGAFGKLKALYDEAGDSLTKEQLQGITTTIETIRKSIIS